MIRFCDPLTGRETGRFTAHRSEPVRALAFSSDGKWLASAGEDQVTRVWDRATGKQLFEVVHPDNVPTAVAFASDGRRLAAITWSGTAIVVDAATGKALYTFG